jgi:NADPH2 dehydrogenase
MSHLFKDGNIGKISLKNRIIMAPMCMYSSDNSGEIKAFHHYHYTSRAVGGVGLIIVEATAIEPRGRISDLDLGLWDDKQIKKHKRLNKKIHLLGAKTAIQLAHAGRKSQVIDTVPIAPSSIAFSEILPYKIPVEASIKDIKEIKKLFLEAAIRAKYAGYDAIELHAAHGYLLCEFLSPLSNKREDIYGGSLENRCRLVLEIAKELKKKVDLPLMVRISAHEWMKKGWSVNDSVYLCSKLEEIGVDCIHVSGGGNQSNPDNMPKIDDLYQVNEAQEIKRALKKTPVIAVGLIKNAVQAEYLLKNKYCDFVAFGRALLRNPNLAFELAKDLGDTKEINSSYQRAF